MYTNSDLSPRVVSVFQYIQSYISKNGYSPSLLEIMAGTDIKSLRGVTIQLDKLEEVGYIRRNKKIRRSIQIIDKQEETISIPLVGEVRAGEPVLAEQNILEYKNLPLSILQGRNDAYLLKIKGNSMNKAGYYPGDIAIVLPQSTATSGDIVIACNADENEATIKKFKMMDGYYILIPQSTDATYKPFIGNDFQIQGKVIGKIH